MVGVCRDMRVDRGLAAFRQPARPAFVPAARVERVAGEVEVVFVAPDDDADGRADLDQVGRVPRAAQRDRRLVEEHVDVQRLVRLSRAALLGLLDQPHDRRVPLGEGDLVGERRPSG